jgi:predicted nuclease of predicted toxin-antitoxin system
VDFLRTLGHDVVRIPEALPASAPDEEIIRHAFDHGRVIVTQDLDFSALAALSGANRPSVPSLRLSSSRVEPMTARQRHWRSALRSGQRSRSLWRAPCPRPATANDPS